MIEHDPAVDVVASWHVGGCLLVRSGPEWQGSSEVSLQRTQHPGRTPTPGNRCSPTARRPSFSPTPANSDDWHRGRSSRGSASASSPTVLPARRRASPTLSQNWSRLSCASNTVATAAVRHHRCPDPVTSPNLGRPRRTSAYPQNPRLSATNGTKTFIIDDRTSTTGTIPEWSPEPNASRR